MKAGAKRVPKWESELWGYLGSGDGMRCPMYTCCQYRLSGGWCISDHKEHLDRLLDGSRFDYGNYDFVECVTPGRIFMLLEKLAEKYLEMGKVCHPPVPRNLIAIFDPQRSTEVREVPLRDHLGAIWRLNSGWIIYLNSNDTPGSKRFTLFHEAFHILAHNNAIPVFRKRGAERGAFNELLAEHFATCLLMPEEWVRGKWAEVRDLKSMAQIFDVPERAMWVRLKWLRLFSDPISVSRHITSPVKAGSGMAELS